MFLGSVNGDYLIRFRESEGILGLLDYKAPQH